MPHKDTQIALAGIAVAAVALSIAIAGPKHEPIAPAHAVPAASTVFHTGDGRAEGNSEDKTY